MGLSRVSTDDFGRVAILRKRGIPLVLVALGGSSGAIARYLLGVVSGDALGTTLLVNVGGSVGLGLLLFGYASQGGQVADRVRVFLGTGFFASFTTYSTFVADIALSDPGIAAPYLIASHTTGIGGVWVARECAQWIGGSR